MHGGRCLWQKKACVAGACVAADIKHRGGGGGGVKTSADISIRHKVLREKFSFWRCEIFCAGHIRSPPSP